MGRACAALQAGQSAADRTGVANVVTTSEGHPYLGNGGYLMERSQVYSVPGTLAGTDVATTSAQIVAETPTRRMLLLTNDSDTVIYLAVATAAVVNRGMRIAASGGTLLFGTPGRADTMLPLTTQEIRAIHGGVGSKRILVQEAT